MSLWGSLAVFLALAPGFFPGPGAAVEPGPAATEPSPSYNDYARYIAGLSNPEGGLADNEEEPAWIRYANAINERWAAFNTRQLQPMRAWAAKELDAAHTDTVFYPFSGPDFVNIYTLFPQARTYLLVALEPVGEIPDFDEVDEGVFFPSLQRSLYEYLYIDFFITAKMKSALGGRQLRGVLPVLLFFLAREKAQVLQVSYWMMDPDGNIQEVRAIPGLESLKEGSIPGVRIVFKGPGSAEKQTLYYFRFNLQNGSWSRHPEFVSFLKSFGPLTSFTKAASYILSSSYSSAVRQFILDQSFYALQDDTGIPLRFFEPALWNLKFYGTYIGPINLFRNQFQPDLAAAFQREKDVYPLPFGIGYRFRPGTSNLIFAEKKTKPAAAKPKRPGI